MKIRFTVNYHTSWGQQVHVLGSLNQLGEDLPERGLPMKYLNEGQWEAEIELTNLVNFTYKYIVVDAKQEVIQEWGDDRLATVKTLKANGCTFDDTWRSNGEDKLFYSAAFTEGLIARKPGKKASNGKLKKSIVFNLMAPRVASHLSIAIVGNCTALGNWDENKAVVLSDKDFPMWTVRLNAAKMEGKINYKYLLFDKKKKVAISWENRDDRSLNLQLEEDETYIKNDEVFVYEASDQFKAAGIALPIFSLRTKNSFGIGEFSDLKPMVDWSVKTGQKVIQTLPINDTTRFHTNADSYPYSGITVMGLHPIYINIFKIGKLTDAKQMKKFKTLGAELNTAKTVKYQEVAEAKWTYFRLIFEQNGAETMASAPFKKFLKENKTWLLPYAAFCYLRDLNNECNFNKWATHNTYDAKEIQKLFKNKKTKDEVNLHVYLQYHAHIQLLETSNYAKSKGIVLKGDIPIGISPDSVEAWMEPEMFNLDSQAGAPPDPFSKTGQNWGFPTYDWERMEKDGYQWWKTRFKKMESYFQVYRIDHVLGFFRIWRMSSDAVQGLLGHFDPALPLSERDICNYGTWFEYHRMVHPYIREHMLEERFGDRSNYIKSLCLELVSSGIYRFNEHFSTQRKVEAYFEENPKELKQNGGEEVYEKILALHCEVLFIEDSKQKGKFHPRIGFHETASYQDLDWTAKEALNQLYNDFYYHRHNDFWKEQAMKKLPALLQSTNMLCCAEDLGMIPSCVPEVMDDLFMLSLEIERMPKDPSQLFVDTPNNPYLSVCTPSTHDMAPIRGWWEEDTALTQKYFNGVLNQQGEAPSKCEAWICEKIIDRHLQSPSMLTIFPFQDWIAINDKYRRKNGDEERINIPSDPKHFWCYRMHMTIEELLKTEDLNYKILSMTEAAKRN